MTQTETQQTSSLDDFNAGKPGIYQGIPAEIYHALNACSFSRLAKLKRSPAHCLDSISNPARTPSMIFGDAVHLSVLQPELFDKRYVVAGPCCATKKGDGGACTNAGIVEHENAWYCGVHKPKGNVAPSGRTVLTAEEYRKCTTMRQNVLEHPKARDLIESEGDSELSIVWVDEETQLVCKGRVDKWSSAFGAIGDLKTTPNVKRRVFERKIFEFGYHIQADMYLRGMNALGLEAKHFVIVAVEKERPHVCQAYRVLDDVCEAGFDEARDLIRQYASCLESNSWPGGSDRIVDIGLPAWAWRELEQGDDD